MADPTRSVALRLHAFRGLLDPPPPEEVDPVDESEFAYWIGNICKPMFLPIESVLNRA